MPASPRSAITTRAGASPGATLTTCTWGPPSGGPIRLKPDPTFENTGSKTALACRRHRGRRHAARNVRGDIHEVLVGQLRDDRLHQLCPFAVTGARLHVVQLAHKVAG